MLIGLACLFSFFFFRIGSTAAQHVFFAQGSTDASPGFGRQLIDSFRDFSAGRLLFQSGKKGVSWQSARRSYLGSHVSVSLSGVSSSDPQWDSFARLGKRPTVLLSSASGGSISLSATAGATGASLALDLPRSFKPGLYHLDARFPGSENSVEQDFAWGVLAVNTGKDRYRVGETADFAFGVLNAQGEIVCDASLTLSLRAPDGSLRSLSTNDGTIAVTGTCGRKETGLIEPDYRAEVTLDQTGTYTYDVVAVTQSGTWTVSGELPVVTSYPVMIRRQAATRLWPFGSSPMTITVHFNQDFAGTIVDTVPAEFSLSGISGNGSVKTPTPAFAKATAGRPGPSPGGGGVAAQAAGVGEKTISWSGSWKAGQTVTFRYMYDAPDVSPEFFLVGPLMLKPKTGPVLQELRQWQIANDAPNGWIAGNFGYRKALTIANANVDATLNNFPLYVKINGDTAIGASVQSDGDDIRFATSTGMILPHEEELFSVSSGAATGYFWVKVPTIVASGSGNGSGATIYMYYGSGSAADGQNKTGVWDTNFKGVWHLPDGSTLSTSDSTSNTNNLTNGSTAAGSGRIDGAGNFSSSYLSTPTLTSINTISGWVKFDTISTTQKIFRGSPTHGCLGIYNGAWERCGVSGTSLLADTWYYVTVVEGVGIYVNASVNIASTAGAISSEVLNFGGPPYSEWFDGTLDELRVSSTARSAAWIKFEYYNMSESDQEISFGVAQAQSGNFSPAISAVSVSPNPVDAGNTVTFSATWTDGNTEGVKLYVCKAADGTTTGCGAGGTWCSATSSYSLTNPATCSYAAQQSDVGAHNYYVYACDDEPSCSIVSTGEFTVGQWLSGFSYRKRIVVSNANVDANLSNFPLYVKVAADANIGANAQSDGDDIRFTSGTGMVLPHEEEYFSVRSGSGSGNFWVKVPTVKTSTGTVIFVYYGSGSATDGQNVGSVWDSNFKGVWHLKETSGQHADSTANANNSTTVSVTTQGSVTGKVDGADKFNGSTNYVEMPGSASLNVTGAGITLSGWVYFNGEGIGNHAILSKRYGSSLQYAFGRYSSPNTYPHKGFMGLYTTAWGDRVMSNTTLDDGQWYYISTTYDGSNAIFFLNGASDKSTPLTGNITGDATNRTVIGADAYAPTWNEFTNANIDEVRVSSTARSAAWIKFEYNNMNSTTKELSWAAQEAGNAAPTITSVADTPDSVDSGSDITFSVDWDDADSEGIKLYVCKAADGTTAGCGAGGSWCTASDSFALTNPAICTSTTQTTDSGTKNYYIYACDDEPSCSTVTSGTFDVNEWLSGFSYRKRIVVSNTNVDANLSNFPLYLKVTADANIGANAQSDGDDIRFTSGTGMILPHEEEYFSVRSGSGSGNFWVKVPTVKTATGTVIFLYYGSGSAADGQSASNVWDGNYAMVWHLPEDVTDEGSSTNVHLDSTAAGRHGDQAGNVESAGVSYRGQLLDGTDDYIITNAHLTAAFSTETVMLSVWFYPTAGGVIVSEIGQKGINTGWHDSQIEVLGTGETKVRVWNMTSVSVGTASFNQWNHAVLTYDKTATALTGYLNGVAAVSSTSGDRLAPWESGYNQFYALGAIDSTQLGDGTYFDGSIEEFRVSTTIRTAAWIKFEYNNINSASKEMSWAAQEASGEAGSSRGSDYFYFLD